MTLQQDLDKLIEANNNLYQEATKLHKKAAERIASLEEGLTEIKQVADVSEGAEFYAHVADKALGFDAKKREEARNTLNDLMSLTYGEHVWSGNDES